MGTSSGRAGRGAWASSRNRARSFSRANLSMKWRSGGVPCSSAVQASSCPALKRDHGLLVNRRSHRLHEKISQHQRQSDQGLIAGSRLRAQRLAQEMKYHQQARKRESLPWRARATGSAESAVRQCSRAPTRRPLPVRSNSSPDWIKPERRLRGVAVKPCRGGKNPAIEHRRSAFMSARRPLFSTRLRTCAPALLSPAFLLVSASSSGVSPSRASKTSEEGVPPTRKRCCSNSTTATKRRSPSGRFSHRRRRRGARRLRRKIRSHKDRARSQSSDVGGSKLLCVASAGFLPDVLSPKAVHKSRTSGLGCCGATFRIADFFRSISVGQIGAARLMQFMPAPSPAPPAGAAPSKSPHPINVPLMRSGMSRAIRQSVPTTEPGQAPENRHFELGSGNRP